MLAAMMTATPWLPSVRDDAAAALALHAALLELQAARAAVVWAQQAQPVDTLLLVAALSRTYTACLTLRSALEESFGLALDL